MSEKSELFKIKWSCEKHPGCIFSIPCECTNCKKFEIALNVSVKKERPILILPENRYRRSPVND